MVNILLNIGAFGLNIAISMHARLCSVLGYELLGNVSKIKSSVTDNRNIYLKKHIHYAQFNK